MKALRDTLAHWYFSRFLFERGKWQLWVALRRFLQPHSHFAVERDIKYGIRLRLNPAEDYIDRFIYYWDCWEPNETYVIRRLLREGDVFVDVGANIGYFTLLASKIVGEDGKIISFEPVPATAAKLRENVRLNGAGNVLIHDKAVTDKPGLVKIGKTVKVGLGMSTIRVSGMMREVWEVPAVRLDQILADERPIRLVKIDVEGAELLAIKGYVEYLKSDMAPSVLCEVTDAFLRELGGSSRELYSLMDDLGYVAYRCTGRKIIPFNRDELLRMEQANILFSKVFIN